MFSNNKKLTLREIHEVYLLLEHTLPEKEEKYFLSSISTILGRTTNEEMIQVLDILKIEHKKNSGIKILTLFIRSIKANNFFEYVAFIRKQK